MKSNSRELCLSWRHSLSVLAISSCFVAASSTVLLSQTSPPLGTAQNFAALAGSTTTNTGPTVLTGDLGVSPGTAITGFPPGNVQNGTIYAGGAVALQAQSDSKTAYGNLTGQACNTTYGVPTDVGGMTLAPGVYCFTSSAQLTGTLTLDAGGKPDAVWIFKTGSTLTTASNSSVKLINSAQECKVFWQVGSSATVGTGTDFAGTILALTSITLNTDAKVSGRVLALNGAVTLDSNTVSFSPCRHACYEVTSKVTHTIMVAPPAIGTAGSMVHGTVSGVALSPDGKTVWVVGYNDPSLPGFVSQVNIASHKVESAIPVGASPSNIAFSVSARAWVTNQFDSTLTQLDVPLLKPYGTIPVGAPGSQYPFGVAVAANHLIVTTSGQTKLAPVYQTTWPLTLRSTLAVSGQGGRPIAVPDDALYQAKMLLVPVFTADGRPGVGHPSLNVVNPSSAKVVAVVSLPTSGAVPEAVVVTPSGRYAYVSLFDSTGGAGGVWVIDMKSLTTKKVILTGDAANYGEAMSADGQYLLVAGFTKNQVALIYTASNSVDNIIQGGEQPNAIALTGDDTEAYVTNQTDGTVTVISFTPHL